MSQLVNVQFHDDTLQAVQQGGKVWVSLRRCCECLGVDYSSQLQKLKSKSWATVGICPTVAEDQKQRDLAMIDLDTLPMWLATIEEGKVAEHARPKLVRYQKECARVLSEHFFPRQPDTGDPILDSLAATERLMQSVRQTYQAQRELEQRQIETEKTVGQAITLAQAAMRQSEGNHGYLSLRGYCNLTGRSMPYRESADVGKVLSRRCRLRGIRIGRVKDERDGYVNSYPEHILREYFGDDTP